MATNLLVKKKKKNGMVSLLKEAVLFIMYKKKYLIKGFKVSDILI